MWFKNARIYLTSVTDGDLEAALSQFPFHPCQSLDPVRAGFVPSVGSEYAHRDTYGATLVCFKKQEKLIPSGAVTEALNEKIAQIQDAEQRTVGRKEKQSLKDELIFSFLPKALTKSKLTYAYFSGNYLVVDSANAKGAEDVCSKLREALGSMPCVPVKTVKSVGAVLTALVAGQYAGYPGFKLGHEVEFQAPKDGRVVRCKNVEIENPEIQSHIAAGMVVTKLQLVYKDRIIFTICDDLSIRAMKFHDVIQECSQGSSVVEQQANDFAVMRMAMDPMMLDLFQLFGGVDNSVNNG